MIPLDVYRTYLSVRNHFTRDTYNFFKFGGKTKASSGAFEKRRDRYIFDKVSKDYKDDEVALLFVSNFVAKEKFWIGNTLSEESRNIYTMWRKKIQSLSYIFENDVKVIIDEINDREIDFDSVFKIQDGQHPIILRLTLADRISLESFLILNKIPLMTIFNNLQHIITHGKIHWFGYFFSIIISVILFCISLMVSNKIFRKI